MYFDVLRIADAILAVFWIWVLLLSIRSRRIGGQAGFKFSLAERPGQYWFALFIIGLMALHFGGLAIVGQHR